MLWLLVFSGLFAHKLYILADDDGKTLHVKSYFTKSSPCMNCDIKILDKKDKVLGVYKTNDSGEANIPIVSQAFDIEVSASMGHQNKISYESDHQITIDENVSISRIIFSLGILFFIFFLLFMLKRKK